jgi:hypothetical protein
VEYLAEAGEPTECVEEARGGCLFVLNFTLRRSSVLTEGKRRDRPNMTMLLQ